MTKIIAAAFFAAALLSPLGAVAGGGQGGHHKPQYGGVVAEVKQNQYELVAKPDSIAIYVDDHGEKINTKGGSAKVTLLNGSEKTEASFVPAGENKLAAKGTFKVEKGTKVVAVVSVQSKPAQSVRFTVK